MSRSIFKNFLQNLEGKFTKSSSRSKALIHYPMGCLRRHCTTDLFISSYPHCTDLAETLMVLTELYVSSHPLWPLPWNSWCSRYAGISNDSQCRVGAEAVIMCAQVGITWPPPTAVAKGMLYNPNQYTDLVRIHAGIHTQSGWNALEHHLAEMTPVT